MIRRFGRARSRGSSAYALLRCLFSPLATLVLFTVAALVLVTVLTLRTGGQPSAGAASEQPNSEARIKTAPAVIRPPVTKLTVARAPIPEATKSPPPSERQINREAADDAPGAIFCSDAVEAKRKRALAARGVGGASSSSSGRASLLNGIDFPHNHKAPAALQASKHDSLLMSFSLAGARDVIDGNLLATHGDTAGDFSALTSGWYCFIARDTNEQCLVAATEFVVQEGNRKGTEYAVPAVTVVDMLTVRENYLAEVAAHRRMHVEDDTARREQAEEARPQKSGVDDEPSLSVVCPRAVPAGLPALCTARFKAATAVDAEASSSSAADRVLREALRSTLRLQLSVSSSLCDDPSVNRAVDVDLYGGVGSFWIAEPAKNPTQAARKHRDVDDAPPFYGLGDGHRVLLRRNNCKPEEGGDAVVDFVWNASSNFDLPREPQPIRLEKPEQLQVLSKSDMRAIRSEVDLRAAAAAAEKNRACRLYFTQSFVIKQSIELGVAANDAGDAQGCVLAFAPGVILTIDEGANCTIRGHATSPVLLAPANPAKLWGGVVLRSGSALTVEHAVVTHTGGSTERVKGTGTHVKLTPAFTASDGSHLRVSDTTIANCKGSGFGLGKRATAEIRRTLIQDVAQGGECVSCIATLEDVHIVDVPYRPAKTKREIYEARTVFIDEDNDGFYFRGGAAEVRNVMIANTLDDGIDSASSKGDAEHSTLKVVDTIIWNVQHEGIALSGSKGVDRTVTIERSVFAFCQQGVENGYSPSTHQASIDSSLFLLNSIGVRHGDNYNLDVHGTLVLTHTSFVFNKMAHILNFVKKERAHPAIITREHRKPLPSAERVTTNSVTFRSVKKGRTDDGEQAHLKVDADPRHSSKLLLNAIDFSQTSASAVIADVHSGSVCGVRHFTVSDAAPNADADGNVSSADGSWWTGVDFPEALPLPWQWVLEVQMSRYGKK